MLLKWQKASRPQRHGLTTHLERLRYRGQLCWDSRDGASGRIRVEKYT